jgi:hypothetical protein
MQKKSPRARGTAIEQTDKVLPHGVCNLGREESRRLMHEQTMQIGRVLCREGQVLCRKQDNREMEGPLGGSN